MNDIGLEWLENIPHGWQRRKLKYVASLKSGDGITTEDIELEGLYPVYGGNGLRGYSVNYTHDGDFVLIGRQGALCGNINYANGKFWASEHAVVATPVVKIATRWLGELLRIMNLNQYSISAAQPGLAVDRIQDLALPVPPLSIQKTIAAYLDKENARIDELIAKKERQIELLEEKRQAIITRAITRGLDPKANMKDSGVEWIGEIPEGWEVRRLTFCATFISGATPDKGNDSYWSGEIPWVSPKDMKRKYIDDSIDHLTAQAVHESGLRTVSVNMILVVVRGMILAHSFPVAIAVKDVTINQDIKALKFDDKFDTEYAAYQLIGFANIIVAQYTDESAHGTKAIRMENWKDFPILCPSIIEQRHIAEYLSQSTMRIDTAISKISRSVELLNEYRSSLITAAVSGQIDVSGKEARP
jgi:type I restriction enzyme S subunit